MLSAISAEASKLLRHRATWFLVWIYPIGITLIFVLAMGESLFSPDPPKPAIAASKWIEQTTAIWFVPGFATALVGAYAALVFAGEYSWNTWKLIVPHRARWKLIVAKYVALFGLLFATFLLTAVLTIFLMWAENRIEGQPIAAGITPQGLVQAHWLQALAALAPLLWTLAYTSLAAVLTRSMLAALTISIVIDGAEGLFGQVAGELSKYAPNIVIPLYQALPGYHISNLESWIVGGSALQRRFPNGTIVELPWTGSLAVAVGWIIGIGAVTLIRFQRQDIN
jgi:ABC-type transport system involved in multi-copper enzyme maturation permease subunit